MSSEPLQAYESRDQDISKSIAIIVDTPSYLLSYQYHTAKGFTGEPPDDVWERFGPIVAELAAEMASELSSNASDDLEVQVSPYFPSGPGRGGAYGSAHYLIDFGPDLFMYLLTLEGALSLGERLHGLVQMQRAKLVEWRAKYSPDAYPEAHFAAHDEDSGILFVCSSPVVVAVCQAFALNQYGEPKTAQRDLTSYCRPFGFGTEQRPNGNELHHVELSSREGRVVFLVDGKLRVWDHYLIKSKRAIRLEIPELRGKYPMHAVD